MIARRTSNVCIDLLRQAQEKILLAVSDTQISQQVFTMVGTVPEIIKRAIKQAEKEKE